MEDMAIDLQQLSSAVPESVDRWNLVDLGLFMTISTLLFKDNITMRSKMTLIMVMNMIISFADSCSDFLVADALFAKDHWQWGVAVLVVDYIPGWLVFLCKVTSNSWSDLKDTKEKFAAVIISIFAPIATPLFQLQWLTRFSTNNDKKFVFLHSNARIGELASIILESPMQLVLLLVLYTKGKLELPWNTDSTIEDDLGNIINLGAVPGMFSFIMCGISIVRGSIEVSEAVGWKQNITASSFALCTAAFRITSYALAIIYFRVFSLFMFGPLILATIIMVLRLDRTKRQDFSLLATVCMSLFVPCGISSHPHLTQLKGRDNTKRKNMEFRNILASQISMLTTPVILAADLVLLLVLKYHGSFKTASDIIVDKDTTIMVIALFVLPAGVMAFMAGWSLRAGSLRKRDYTTMVLSVAVFLTCAISSIALTVSGKNTLYI